MASPAVVGTRPPRARAPTYSRDSNALRASVLNVALELGVGTSRAVENLIFDSFPEEDEENELVTTPPLTSASVATSDESWPSLPTWGGIPGQFVMPVRKPSNATAALNSGMEAVGSPSEDSHTPTVPLPHQPRKLRKARKDAYEGDAGNLNDDVKRKKGSKKGSLSTLEGEFPSDGGYLSDATKKGADKKKKEKKATAEPSTQTSNKSTKKTRTSSDDGDLSDRGYQSEASTKKKKTFFRLRSRSPSVARKGTPSDGSGPPPVPALPTTPLPVSPHFIRTPTPFSWLDGVSLNSATTLRAAHSPVPSSLDGRDVLASSIPSKDSPPPPSENTDRTATRSLSIDTTSDSLTLSTTSHEIGPHGLSPVILGKQTPMSAPAAALPHDLRFTSSRRFGSSDALFPISQPSPVVAMTSGKLSPRPKTSPSATSSVPKASPSSIQLSIVPPISRSASPMFPPSDIQPFISRTLRPSPSPLQLTSSASPPLRAVSPSLSQSSIIPSSDYILPSPRPRFYEDLPPPSPPPSCPLPELPSSNPYQPPVPVTQRGRQSPFPVRGALPVQDSSSVYPTKRIPQEFFRVREEDIAMTTANTVGNRVHGDVQGDVLPGLVEGVTVIPSSPHNQIQEDDTEWPDGESVRPYMAQFHPYGLPSRSFGVGEILPRPWPDVPDDERHSTSTFQRLTTSSTTNIRASAMPSSPAETDIYSYYFEEPDQDQGRDGGDSERRSHASSVDDDHRRETRTRLPGIGYADALYGTEKIPPVPKIRPF